MSDHIELHVQAWVGDRAHTADDAYRADGMLHGVLFVNGHEVRNHKVKVETASGTFMKVTVELIPGSFEVVTHDADTWPPSEAQRSLNATIARANAAEPPDSGKPSSY